ncbi:MULTISPECIES: pseudouridine synthase [Butyricimonas]|jgi:pseudouridylate synthase|uniref:Pseudouridine synthase n=2 Tax=Butyricimonas faecihominis TaxID=1472416 RepID=A0A7W6HYW6_9BACT|nr:MULTISPECIES: pseudouridine synthase [Butyricimonas]MBS6687907.1 pseudouridine synthase [Sanguibacteroides justesenii]OKZ17394.1 MAG: pseudouridine synthase [Butyricimonas synergistica]KAB1504731.1 pseudouridine synthase [Butyricimonas faecihominis]MBB4027195.1 23S rRNA pseudouridine2605 synthase [Butyricimonas faecihominis]OUN62742.1 pseudouridine synthase [Butyricimonas sp. An62]
MNRETKRPRITRPIENRDENRRSRTPRFENREGGESETRRPNRFNTDRPRREQGHGYIRDLNKERERERNEGTGDRDNGNRYYRDSDRNRERGDRENNRYENRDNRRSYERGNRDNNRFSDRGERRERRPQDRDENAERRDNRYQNRDRNDRREEGRRERGSREEGGRGEGYRGDRRDRREGDDRRDRYSDRPARKVFTRRADGDGAPKSVYSKKKQIEYRKKNEGQETELRLNRYIAKGGVCSRRDADVLIAAGRVKVNGEVVQQVGVKVKRTDRVEVDDQVITPERKVYLVLNKPKDYVTTVEDPLERRTVMTLIEGACKERVYPIGRLDRQTTGVLLFTNDGDLAKKLTHPKYNQKKIYHVFLDKVVQTGDLEAIRKGIDLEDGFIQADDVRVAEDDRTQVGIEIHSGRNRIVRRIFEHLGYQILRLDRVFFAGITKKNLPRGHWRFLTEDEVNILKAY